MKSSYSKKYIPPALALTLIFLFLPILYAQPDKGIIIQSLEPNKPIHIESDIKVIEHKRMPITFNKPVEWLLRIEYNNTLYNISYKTPPIFITESTTMNASTWQKTITLTTNSSYNNIQLNTPIPTENIISVQPFLPFYTIAGENRILITIPQLKNKSTIKITGKEKERILYLNLNNERYDILMPLSSTETSIGAYHIKIITNKLFQITHNKITIAIIDPIISQSSLNLSTKNIIKISGDFPYSHIKVHIKDNISAIYECITNCTHKHKINFTKANNTVTFNASFATYILKKFTQSPKIPIQTEFGMMNLSTDAGFIQYTSLINNELNIEITNLQPYEIATLTIELPFSLPQSYQLYLWKKINNKTKQIPYTLNSQRNKIMLELQDGVIDEDNKANGVIKDPLKLFLPRYKIKTNITKNNAIISIIENNKEVKINTTTTSGIFSYIKITDPANTINKPNKKFPYKLIKFRLENVTEGRASIYIKYPEPLKAPEYWKFNPKSGKWQRMPFQIINKNTIKITIEDNGPWDENPAIGIIEDDSGIAESWWNVSWKYRKPINITYEGEGNLTDYQLKLSLDTQTLISEGKMNSNCSDMRFTWWNDTSSSEQKIPYWIESGCNTTSTKVWVKVPLIRNITYGNETILMYYGNLQAGSGSNGTETFIFFDDFEDGIDEWSGGSIYVNDTLDPYGSQLFLVDSTDVLVSSSYVNRRDVVIRMLVYDNDTGSSDSPDADVGFIARYVDSNNYLEGEHDTDTGFHYEQYVGGSYTQLGNVADDYIEFYRWEWQEWIAWGDSSGTYKAKHWYINESEPTTYQLIASSPSITSAGQVGIHTASGRALIAVYIVREWTSPEPSFVVREEEYCGRLNATVTHPSEDSVLIRYEEFWLNGTVYCKRGDCGNVYAYPEYISTSSALQEIVEDTHEDFKNYSEKVNISVSNTLKLQQKDSWTPWWNTSWKYREVLNISNPNSYDLTDYQVLIYLNSSYVGPNFNWTTSNSSLRFIKVEEGELEKELHYWIEYWNETAQEARIWIKIDYLPANSNITVVMYYGNSDAQSKSNGTNVFEFFDDFTQGISKWSTLTNAQIVSTSSHYGNSVLSVGGSGGTSGKAVVDSNYFLGSDAVVRMLVYDLGVGSSGSPDADVGFIARYMDDSNKLWGEHDTDEGFHYEQTSGGTTTRLGNVAGDYIEFNRWEWQEWKACGTTDSGHIAKHWYWEEKEPSGYSLTTSGVNYFMSGQAGVLTSSGQAYVDVYMVRKCADSEPIVHYGNEETVNLTSSGYYISKIFDLGSNEVEFGNISWIAQTNENTSIEVYTRSSDGTVKGWWDRDWEYRKNVTISSSQPLTNFQVKIDVDTGTLYSQGKIRSDCGDVRFVKYEATEQWSVLPYWNETPCNTSGTTTFWIKTDLISGTNSIQMYYGNDNAQSQSNGNEVFEFFDDFLGNDINTSKWQVNANDYSVSNGVLRINIGAVSILNKLPFRMQDGYILEGRIKYHTTSGGYSGTLSAQSSHYTAGGNGNSDATSLYMRCSGSLSVCRWTGSGSQASYDCGSGTVWTSENDVWYILGAKFDSSGVTLTKDRTTSYTYGCGWTKNITYISLGAFHGASSYDVQDTSYDWVLIRKLASTEPTVSFNGEENYTIFSQNPSNLQWSSWFEQANNSKVQCPPQRYIQYKVVMNTSNSKQTPIFDKMEIAYQIVATTWTGMEGPAGDTIFTTTSNPIINCGELNESNPTCNVSWSVVPRQVGNYSLRICANSSDPNINSTCSLPRNVSVWMQPSIAEFTSSLDPVGKGEITTLQAKLTDDQGIPMKNKNITFIDETGDGTTSYEIGNATTDSNGYASIDYLIPQDAYLGYHTLNASFSGNEESFILPASTTITILVSSTPKITNITATPQSIGFGYNVTITANVTDEKDLDKVLINLTYPNGTSIEEEMVNIGGDLYQYVFTDSWLTGTYTYYIFANNTDGVSNQSTSHHFYINAYLRFNFTTQKDIYKNYEYVYLNSTKSNIWYHPYKYRIPLTISSSQDLSNYQLKISLDSSNFNFNNAQPNGEDVRFTYWNTTSQQEQEIPYWIEKWNSTEQEAIIWVKVPYINSSSTNLIYLYHGNTTPVESASNGNAVFNFFDEFSGTSLNASKWTATSASNVNVSNGWVTINRGSIYTNNIVGSSPQNHVFEAKVKYYTQAESYAGLCIANDSVTSGGNSGSDALAYIMTESGGNPYMTLWGADGTTSSYNIVSHGIVDSNVQNENEYIIGFEFRGSSQISYFEINYTSGVEIGRNTYSGTWSDDYWLWLGYFTGAAAGTADIDDMSVDWVRVRKYASSEPSISFGDVEFGLYGLENYGSEKSKGYLYMKVEKWDESNGQWVTQGTPVVDNELIEIQGLDVYNISINWDQNPWYTYNRDPGLYRVFAKLYGPSYKELINSYGEVIEGYYEFNITKAVLVVSDLTYENKEEYSVEEYEVGDVIDWINVTVKAVNNTAIDANVTLNILKGSTIQTWGPNETKQCGEIPEGETCERRWDNSTSGYRIPLDVASGSYDFRWNVTMLTRNGDVQTNHSLTFKIHNIPSTFSHAVTKIRLYKPDWSYYNFTFTNLWSENITNVKVKINCPSIEGMECTCINSGTDTCDLGEVLNTTQVTVEFNVSANESVPSGDYNINITLNYTNPGNEEKSWKEYENQVFEIRTLGILEINPVEYPVNVTRTYSYDFKTYINNTGDDTSHNVWLNYTLPSGWTNSSGLLQKHNDTLPPAQIMWNNITASIGITSQLGEQQIHLDSSSDEGQEDFKTLTVYVFANTSIPEFDLNKSSWGVNRGDVVRIWAKLVMDNGTAISGENVSFWDETTNSYLGSALTNASGYAVIYYTIPQNEQLGTHTWNASYTGNNAKYLHGTKATTTVTIHSIPKISNIQANPSVLGFGFNISISASLSDEDGDTIINSTVRITYPNGTLKEFECFVPPSTCSYTFNDTWQLGTYNFTIWVEDSTNTENESSKHNFTVNVTAEMLFNSEKTLYNPNEYVNLINVTHWLDSSLRYRIPINITSAQSLSNYQLKISLDSSNFNFNNAQPNGEDVRFTYWNTTSQQEQEIPYWIEKWNSTEQEAIIWVKVPYINSSSTNLIYLYHGNTTPVESASNGNAVFNFFDEFSGTSLNASKWTATSASNVNVSNGWVTINRGSIYTNNIVGSSPQNHVFEAKVKYYTQAESYSGLMIADSQGTYGGNSGGNALAYLMTASSSSPYLQMWGADGTTSSYNIVSGTTLYSNLQNEHEYIIGFEFRGTTTLAYFLYEIDYTQLASSSYSGTWSANYWLWLGYFTGKNAGTADIDDISVDWVRVRKYASSEPSISFGDTERYGSKIYNKGTTNFKGYLRMKVQRNVSGVWQDVETVIDDLSNNNLRNIGTNGLDLSAIWNSNAWYTDAHDAGKYRIYGEFLDPYGNVLQAYGSEINNLSYASEFEIATPPLQLNISNIRIYDVTNALPANWHTYVTDFVGSGTNTTFNLYKDHVYRIEAVVDNIGDSSWQINETNVSYRNLDTSWIIDESSDIWYSNETLDSDARSDTTYQGGSWSDGIARWNTSLKGKVSSGNRAIFFFVVNITSTGDYGVNFRVTHKDFIKNDISTWHIIELDTTPPKLYNNIYGVSNNDILRGSSTVAYARWNEEIQHAEIRFNSTSSTFGDWISISLPSPNPENWTNYTISTTSSWLLGTHVMEIKATDMSNNENNTLWYVPFNVSGLAQVTDGYLEPSTINVTNVTKIYCKVTDNTNSNSPVANYVVHFYNSTHELGTNVTNSTGWAYVSYADNTPGTETLKCNITENKTRFYKIDANNYKTFTLTTKEFEEPKWFDVEGPSLAHKGDTVELKARWTDNYQLAYAKLATNASGWANVSGMQLSGVESWANFTYQIPTSMQPGYLAWKQYANDSFGNENVTSEQEIEVWGWSKVDSINIVPSSVQEGNSTVVYCKVVDANSSSSLASYVVYFYDGDTYLGQNTTNSSGWARWNYTPAGVGVHTIKCNITDNASQKYNASKQNFLTDTLTVTAGPDTQPPKIVDDTYQINDTEIDRGECIKISGQWDETINYSKVIYNKTSPGSWTEDGISPPYTANWTNATICTDSTWKPGNHSIKLWANDTAGNINDTLPYKTFVMWGYAKVYWEYPNANQQVNRSVIKLYCKVIDKDTGGGVEGYTVTFYDFNGINIGSNTTNQSGVAYISYDATTINVGPKQFTCHIATDNDLYYKVNYEDQDATRTFVFYGKLNTTIVAPQQSAILHRGEKVLLNSTTVDENGNAVKDQYGNDATISVNWYNETDQIGSGENITWSIPTDYELGSETIKANSTAEYYYPGEDTVSVWVYGWANVTMLQPNDGSYGENEAINVVCRVTDANVSSAIQNYPVEFFDNQTSLGKQLTNATGYASKTINTNSLSEGAHELRCVIYDNETLYYNASVSEDSTTIIVDKTTPLIYYNPNTDANGSYARNWIFINVSVEDENVDTVLLYWNGTAEQFQSKAGNIYWSNKTGLSDGTYEFYAWVNDTVGNQNQTGVRKVTVDTTPPAISIASPENKTYATDWVWANVSLSESGICNYTLDSGSLQPMQNSSSTYWYANVSGLSEGAHTITYYCNDSVGNQNSTSVTFSVDITLPVVLLNSPQDSYNSSSSTVTFSCHVYDNIKIVNVSLYANFTGSWQIVATNSSGVNNTDYYFSQTLSDGRYVWNCKACDDANCAFNTTNRTITIDTQAPQVTIVMPENKTYNISSVDLKHVTTDENLEACWYYNGTENISLPNCQNTTLTNLQEGSHQIIVYANDSAGNEGSSTIVFSVDLTKPYIFIQSPQNTTYENTNNIDLNYTVSDNMQIDKCWYKLNDGSKQDLPNCQNTTLVGLANGHYHVEVFANDTGGNINSSIVYFTVNVSALVVTVESPQNQSYFNVTWVWGNATTNKPAAACNYSLDGGANVSMSNDTATHWYANVSGLSEGEHNITYYCEEYDTGNISQSDYSYFTVDLTSPSLVITTPQNITYSTLTINLNYSTSDEHAITCYYFNDTNPYIEIPGCQNKTLVFATDGTHVVGVKVVDVAGNVNATQVTFSIDTTPPILMIVSPQNTTYNTNSIWFNISTNENTSACWYSLNAGNNISMNKHNDTYFYKLSSLIDGSYIATFYCNDTLGNENSTSITFSIDTTGPIISYTPPTPADNAALDQNWTCINITTNEDAGIALLEWDYDNGTIINFTMNQNSARSWWYNMTNLNDGSYYYRVYANDSYNNWGSGNKRKVIVSVGAPAITIISPKNITYSKSNIVNISVIASKEIDTWWYSINGRNFTFTPNTTIASKLGTNVLFIYANDSAGNVGSSSVVFSVNATVWEDEFEEYAGASSYKNVTMNGNVSIEFCWPVLKQSGCWPYRKQINISGSSSLLTEYQVKLVVNLSAQYEEGKVNESCKDLRFTWLNSSSGKEEIIPYWIDTCNVSSNSTIWVKVPKIATGGETLYMYYGNMIANSNSNGTLTFEFFDEFNTLEKWNGDDWIASSGVAYPTAISDLISNYEFISSYATEMVVKGYRTSTGSSGYYLFGNANNKRIWMYFYPYDGKISLSNGTETQANLDCSVYHRYTIISDFDNNIYEVYVDNNDTALLSISGANTIATASNATFHPYNANGIYLDMFAIRKYSSPEPGISNVGSEEIALNNGSVTSIEITPPKFYKWAKFYAKANTPTGTGIYFRILNKSNNSICSDINLSSAQNGYDVCSDANNYQSIKLYAYMYTTQPGMAPDLLYWNISWIAEANISIEVRDDGWAINPNSLLRIYYENEIIGEGHGSVSVGMERNKEYKIESITPAPTYNLTAIIYGVSITEEIVIRQQVVDSYSGYLPPNISSITPIYALNDTDLNYSKAKLILPKNNLNIDYVLHCTAWNFTSANCSQWEFIEKTSLEGYGENETHIWFNVTSFEAYGGAQLGYDLKANQIVFNITNVIENQNVGVAVNISNSGGSDANNTVVQLNISLWNGTAWILQQTKEKQANITAYSYAWVNFTWIAKPGTYNFTVFADSTNIYSETNESNNINSTNYTVSAWKIFYGKVNSFIRISDAQGNNFSIWLPDTKQGNLYFSDYDSTYSMLDLAPLNGTNDLTEADNALNMTGFKDSITKLYDKNNDGSADSTKCFIIANEQVCNVPIINSTQNNNGNFITGIVWDKGDGGTEYNGTQDLIFITEINDNKVGGYGTYDYEIRVPAYLRALKPSTDQVTVYMEVI